MENKSRGINLLVLRGVYAKDFTTNTSYKSTPEHIEDSVIYTEIPKRFTCVEEWPTYSNLRCWNCDLLPPSYPRFVPLNPEKDKDDRDVCDPHGNFCEWNCAVRYTMREFSDQQWDILRAICLFESKFSGKHKKKIMPAPAKTKMAAYCGKNGITPKQWRDEMARLNNEYTLPHLKDYHSDRLAAG
jgi:hypothetical protein